MRGLIIRYRVVKQNLPKFFRMLNVNRTIEFWGRRGSNGGGSPTTAPSTMSDPSYEEVWTALKAMLLLVVRKMTAVAFIKSWEDVFLSSTLRLD